MKTHVKNAFLAGLGLLVLTGCLMSGTFVITLHVNAFYSKSDGTFEAHGVDVTTNEVWKDHHDDIRKISDVRLRATIENLSDNVATGVVYFSKNGAYTNPEDVRSATDAFVVFSGLAINPHSERILTFAESATYRQHLEEALKMIESGEFYIYVLTPEGAFSLHVSDVYVMITLDAGRAT